MKNKPLTKKQRRNLIDAWAILNCLCSYLRNNEGYTDKYNAFEQGKKAWKKLDSVVTPLYDDDL